MSIQVVFIIDKKKNVLIFLGIADDQIKINQKELSEILGEISSKAVNLDVNSTSQIKIKNRSYCFANFEKIFIIIQYINIIPPKKEILFQLNEKFLEQYSSLLNTYSEKDIIKFKAFSSEITEIITETISKKSEKREEIGKKPLFEPMERISFPNGISNFQRDEILWKEAKLVKDIYPANFIEGMIFHLEVFLNISNENIYKVQLDFSNYPLKPVIKISEDLKEVIGKNLDDLLYYYKNWNENTPPHIAELIKEIEKVLNIYRARNKLSEAKSIPISAIPSIQPLPNVKID